MDQPKIERLLQLIMMMSGKTDYSIEDISVRLGITPRSVYRYIETLRNAGFAVEKRHSNMYKLVRMPNFSVDLNKLIYFTEEEAFIINKLINAIDGTNTLKAGLLKKLSAIYSLTSIAELVTDNKTSEIIEIIGKAIQTKSQVTLIDYESANSHTKSDRHIEPFAFTTNYIDVWAYDIDKHENRIFKISRTGKAEISENEWEYEPLHSIGHTDCFRMNGLDRIHVRLRLSLRAKNLLIEEYPLSAQHIIETGDKYILDTDVCDLAGIGRFVIGLAAEIEIIDSPELEAYVQQYAKEHILNRKRDPKAPL